MISRRTLLRTAAIGAGGTLSLPYIAREGFAQTPAHTLKLTMADTRNHPLYQVLLRFADDVRKKTGGAVEVQCYGAGELGSQVNILTGLQTGIIDLCAHTSGFIDTLFPQFQVMDLPFLFPDVTSAEKVLDGPVGKQLAGLMPSKGIYSLTYGHWAWRVTSTVDRKLPEPGDMKGLKIRVQPGPIFAATYRALGANPIAIDITEVYLALSQRTIEAIETPVISQLASKHYEVIKTVNITNHVYNAGALLVSKRKFDALPKDIQEKLRAAAVEMTADWRKTIATKTDETTAFFKEKGVTFVDVDRGAYRKETQRVYDEFRPIIGADLFDAVIKQVEKA